MIVWATLPYVLQLGSALMGDNGHPGSRLRRSHRRPRSARAVPSPAENIERDGTARTLQIRRRERVIRIFPTRQSAIRLLGALLMEQDEQWSTGKRYFDMTAYWQWRQTADGGRVPGSSVDEAIPAAGERDETGNAAEAVGSAH